MTELFMYLALNLIGMVLLPIGLVIGVKMFRELWLETHK